MQIMYNVKNTRHEFSTSNLLLQSSNTHSFIWLISSSNDTFPISLGRNLNGFWPQIFSAVDFLNSKEAGRLYTHILRLPLLQCANNFGRRGVTTFWLEKITQVIEEHLFFQQASCALPFPGVSIHVFRRLWYSPSSAWEKRSIYPKCLLQNSSQFHLQLVLCCLPCSLHCWSVRDKCSRKSITVLDSATVQSLNAMAVEFTRIPFNPTTSRCG